MIWELQKWLSNVCPLVQISLVNKMQSPWIQLKENNFFMFVAPYHPTDYLAYITPVPGDFLGLNLDQRQKQSRIMQLEPRLCKTTLCKLFRGHRY